MGAPAPVYRPVGTDTGADPPGAPPRGEPLGAGVATGSIVVPLGRFAGCGAGTIPSGIGGVTVTFACPLTLPCVAVICAVPGVCAVALPVASTVTTAIASLA